MKTLKVHSELQTLLPSLSDEEYKGLEADILEHGCLSPLVTWNDTIVDGHNRYAICQDHGQPFDTVELEFESLDDAKLWAWSHQEHRRNLTPYQRTEIALKFKPMLAAKGKENMAAGGKGLQNSVNLPQTNAQKELAKIAGVSHDTVSRVEYINDHADDETKQRLRNGDTTINREYTRLRVAEEGETPDFDPEPPTPMHPKPPDTFQESVTLQHILLHKTESLVICLFSLFDVTYRKQLIIDLLAKMQEEDGREIVEQVVAQINQQFPITQ
jgi:transcriptional regulator with XRE-family HTH domain